MKICSNIVPILFQYNNDLTSRMLTKIRSVEGYAMRRAYGLGEEFDAKIAENKKKRVGQLGINFKFNSIKKY